MSASTVSPAGSAIAVAPDATHSRICPRFSFRVPSVRGSSDPGHTEAFRMR
jgi:hypothetical protein